jgi:hypothetical protein
MRLRHATPARNLPSILRSGLLTSKSRGRLPAVWFCSIARTAWAALHVIRRHGGRVEQVVVLEVSVPRSWLRKRAGGLWYCLRDIPAGRIRKAVTFGQLAASPVEPAA